MSDPDVFSWFLQIAVLAAFLAVALGVFIRLKVTAPAWEVVAGELGLSFTRGSGLSIGRMEGTLKGLEVVGETFGGFGDRRTGTRIKTGLQVPIPYPLVITTNRARVTATKTRKEVKTGDARFDAKVFVAAGDVEAALALLTPELRGAILEFDPHGRGDLFITQAWIAYNEVGILKITADFERILTAQRELAQHLGGGLSREVLGEEAAMEVEVGVSVS